MTIKDKMKTYNFWISLVSAILLIVQVIGDKYGFSVDSGLVIDITTGVCGIFVILGIISTPQKNQTNITKNEEILNMENVQNNNINEAVDDSDKSSAVGRYQNILLAMKQKTQNTLNNIENMAQNIQNTQISENNCNVVDNDSTCNNVADDDSVVASNVEIQDENVQNDDVVIEVEEDNVALSLDHDIADGSESSSSDGSNGLKASCAQEFCDGAVVCETVANGSCLEGENLITDLVAGLSIDEREELAAMLLNY